MSQPQFRFPNPVPLVVGSFGDLDALAAASPESLALECDIAEIRLDLFHQKFSEIGPKLWNHLIGFPLLFTARCHSEGSPFHLITEIRQEMLEASLPDAALIDIEVANIPAMQELIQLLKSKQIPWIASYHNFEHLPTQKELTPRALLAEQAGAACFKFAAHLNNVDELPALTSLQTHDFGIPTASMGMGSLAPVSRLLCAQHGSMLNYGFIGKNQTAPGQWPAKLLRDSIHASSSL
jgi:3-dehydroquinate dehydratase type I